jgi:transketolase C-terminal domain/subunit
MDVLIKSLGYSTTGSPLSSIEQILEDIPITVRLPIIDNVIPADQLVIPGIIIGFEPSQLPTNLARKAAAGVKKTTSAGGEGTTLTVGEDTLIIPEGATRGVLSTDVKVCKP